jgi:hypothetical protein
MLILTEIVANPTSEHKSIVYDKANKVLSPTHPHVCYEFANPLVIVDFGSRLCPKEVKWPSRRRSTDRHGRGKG